MKALLFTKLMILALVGASSFADSGETQRATTRIDFNKMIDANNTTRAELKKQIDSQAAPENEELGSLDESDSAERSDVVDFVDVELGWGLTPPVVDRRFDSVGAPRPYKMNEQDLVNPESGS